MGRKGAPARLRMGARRDIAIRRIARVQAQAVARDPPILSCVDNGQCAAIRYLYRWFRRNGTRREALPELIDGLRRLLRNRRLAMRLSREGQERVQTEHTTAMVLDAFDRLCAIAGLRR